MEEINRKEPSGLKDSLPYLEKLFEKGKSLPRMEFDPKFNKLLNIDNITGQVSSLDLESEHLPKVNSYL